MKYIFLFTISAIITTGDSRKYYDVDEEARKLYGEDLSSVLLRFRKSTDYLHILKDKADGILQQLQVMTILVKSHWKSEMDKNITETLGAGKNMSAHTRSSNIFKRLRLLREAPEAKVNENPVLLLENYGLLHRELPVSNINNFKALGFEFAGQAIHTIMKHMGADDVARSTRLPYAEPSDQNTKTTSEHPHDHRVTQSEPDIIKTSSVVPEFTATPDPHPLRYFSKKTNKVSG